MKTPSAIDPRPLALVVMLAFAAPALAERALYQWVDGAGNVMYGDSPPTVTYSRTVDAVGSDGPLRQAPGYLTAPEDADAAASPEKEVREQAALVDALGRLEQVMSRMQTLTDHVDRLEHEKQLLQAERVAESAPVQAPDSAVEMSSTSKPAVAVSRAPAPGDRHATVEPKAEMASLEPTNVQARLPAKAFAPTEQKVPAPAAPSVVTTAQPRSPAAAPEDEPTRPAASTQVANLGDQRLDREAIIGPQPLLEVAVPEPQPIKSQMTAKERDRSRWQSQNRAQQRFLQRLTQKGAAQPGD